MDKKKLLIYWARKDFRLDDNPALLTAIEKSNKEKILFLPIFIFDKDFFNRIDSNIGYSSRYLLSKMVSDFSSKFQNFNIFYSNTTDVFNYLSKIYDIEVFANEVIDLNIIRADLQITKIIKSRLVIFQDDLSIRRDTKSGTGEYYKVFTPFKNTVMNTFLERKRFAISEPAKIKYPLIYKLKNISGVEIIEQCSNLSETIFKLLEQPRTLYLSDDYQLNLDQLVEKPKLENWYTSENEAVKIFNDFLINDILNYKKNRDFLEFNLDNNGLTSKMSLGLAWGLVSARTLKDSILSSFGNILDEGVATFINELIWREFYKYILYHNPSNINLEFQKKYQIHRIKWEDHHEAISRFEKWIKGETGYEIVDAAMYQISKIGWMHNRSRMISASILTKNLGVDWRWGQEYFKNILVDYDEASNNGGWQWAASVGADPKPIRIFNPYLQQEKFDPNKKYIKHWLPTNYDITTPIVEHKNAREKALYRYKYIDFPL